MKTDGTEKWNWVVLYVVRQISTAKLYTSKDDWISVILEAFSKILESEWQHVSFGTFQNDFTMDQCGKLVVKRTGTRLHYENKRK